MSEGDFKRISDGSVQEANTIVRVSIRIGVTGVDNVPNTSEPAPNDGLEAMD